MEEQKYLGRDSLFFHLNLVQQGAILALAQAIFTHRSGSRNLTAEDAHLILQQIGGQALPGTILKQLVEAKWLIVGADVTFFSQEVEDYAIIKLAQMIITHFQEKPKEDKETARPRKFRHDYT